MFWNLENVTLLLAKMLMFCTYNLFEQKLKTRVVRKNVNPEWNEELTLSILDANAPIKLVSSFSKMPFVLLIELPLNIDFYDFVTASLRQRYILNG